MSKVTTEQIYRLLEKVNAGLISKEMMEKIIESVPDKLHQISKDGYFKRLQIGDNLYEFLENGEIHLIDSTTKDKTNEKDEEGKKKSRNCLDGHSFYPVGVVCILSEEDKPVRKWFFVDRHWDQPFHLIIRSI